MPLGLRLGILLVVISPQFGYDSARLAYFLEQVPPWSEVAVEFRHPSWHTEEVSSLLERSGATYCALDWGAPSVYPHPVYNGAIRLCTALQPRPQLH